MNELNFAAQNRTSKFGVFAYNSALLLTVYAFVLNCLTLANGDYTSVVIKSLTCACIATLLIIVAWRSIPPMARAIAVPFVLVNLWTLFDAGGRRLPVIMGW